MHVDNKCSYFKSPQIFNISRLLLKNPVMQFFHLCLFFLKCLIYLISSGTVAATSTITDRILTPTFSIISLEPGISPACNFLHFYPLFG